MRGGVGRLIALGIAILVVIAGVITADTLRAATSTQVVLPASVDTAEIRPNRPFRPPPTLAKAPKGPVLYVAPNGDDANTGTADRPFKTIQRAANVVTPGTTVIVAPGEYRITKEVTTRTSGTADARISFVALNAWEARLLSEGAEGLWWNTGDYVDIEGFDLSGDGLVGIENDGSYVNIVNNYVHHIKAVPCTNNGGAGIVSKKDTSSGSVIAGNVVHDIGDVTVPCSFVQGIYGSNARITVANNIVFRVQGFGIHFWHAATGGIVVNNLVFANIGGGITIGAGDDDSGTTVADNFFVANNIVVDNGWGIIENGRTGPKNRYLNNLVFGNRQQALRLLTGQAAGTVAADPRFVAYAPDGSGNYRLQADSPAVDKGVAEQAPATDISGGPRPLGRQVDIGPYER